MEIIIALVVVAVALVLLGVVGYYSVQSFLQGRVLSKAKSLHELKDHLDTSVAVCGSPDPIHQGRGPNGEPAIWYKWEYQVYRRSGKSGSWRTMNSAENGWDFFIHFPNGGRVKVCCEPTEVHGTDSWTEGGGLFQRERTVHRWMPLTHELTVMGHLGLSGEGATLMKDKSLGMLITSSSPGWAAFWEYFKASLGFALILGGIGVGIALLVAIL